MAGAAPVTPPRIIVTAAVIRREGERGHEFFVTRRQAGVHLGGYWEFPGGKCEPGEPLDRCLRREIREELDVDVAVGRELLACAHEYPERTVELRFFECVMNGEPKPMLGQEMRWVGIEELRALQFPPADDELIALVGRLSSRSRRRARTGAIRASDRAGRKLSAYRLRSVSTPDTLPRQVSPE